MVDATSMTVTDTYITQQNVETYTRQMEFLVTNGRIFVVASRFSQFLDIFEVCGDKLMTCAQTRMPIDVTDGKIESIQSLVLHPTESNCMLVAGNKFKLKLISFKTSLQ